MENYIYILSVCDPWTGSDRMQPVGATTDAVMLHAMIAAKIKAGDVTYGNDMKQSWSSFLQDFKADEVDYSKLGRCEVLSYDDMQITEPLSVTDFPDAAKAYEELAGVRANEEIEKLELGSRSLTYSMVELRTDFGYTEFLMAGFCDRDDLQGSDQFQEFMEGTTDAEVNASVITYSIGTGQSEYPDENELAILEKYADELNAEYGVDRIQSDYFSFEYEAEQEY